MKFRYLVAMLAILTAFAFIAGCAQNTPPPTQTTTATTVATPPPVQTTVQTTAVVTTSTPAPVQTLPKIYAVDVQVGGNGLTIDPKIIATFRGGQGINFVTKIDVILTRNDGVVETAVFTPPLSVGDVRELPSTTSNDNRVEVYVSLSTGERYKIFDEMVPFRSFH
ncbi:MAG: hypothetical protein LUQ25_04265 [Methanoregulaceae archaeon]|nr:hypothetical protein [Methanoregulaceae archaeon]